MPFDAREARGSVQEPVRLELGRDLLDGLLDVRGLAGPRAHDLAAAEHEQDDLRFVDAVHEAGELLRLVFGAAQGEGDRLEVELVPEGSRCDDVFDPELRHGNTSGPGSGIPASLEATARNRSLIYFRPPRNPTRKTERTVAGDCRAAESRTLPTPHASMRSTRPFASAHRSSRRNT